MFFNQVCFYADKPFYISLKCFSSAVMSFCCYPYWINCALKNHLYLLSPLFQLHFGIARNLGEAKSWLWSQSRSFISWVICQRLLSFHQHYMPSFINLFRVTQLIDSLSPIHYLHFGIIKGYGNKTRETENSSKHPSFLTCCHHFFSCFLALNLGNLKLLLHPSQYNFLVGKAIC